MKSKIGSKRCMKKKIAILVLIFTIVSILVLPNLKNAQAAVALEAERRCCADGKIVTYVNGTFYLIEVAGLTVTTDTTAKSIYNPLCGCSCPITM